MILHAKSRIAFYASVFLNFLKISIIVFSFIGLPLFLLFYLGIFNSISNPLGRIALVIFVLLLGVIAVITIFKLNYVEIAYDRIDEK